MRILKTFILAILIFSAAVTAQDNLEEEVRYYQMEPFSDSLFIKIQSEVYIDPPDPKAEIIIDLRDPVNQTVAIQGTLYPLLAFSSETRAQIVIYPFKLNLEEQVDYASVFTRVAKKITVRNLISPPTLNQISPSLNYINPFFQLFGGERFGASIKKDFGVSFGFGTPYSGTAESNMAEINMHLLGFSAGFFSSIQELIALKEWNKEGHRHTLLIATKGFQVNYVLPFGNFFQIGLLRSMHSPKEGELLRYAGWDTLGYAPKIIEGSYVNWEFKFPVSILGSTRGKLYAARYLNEYHIGFTGRELSLAGSTFDFRFDAMPHSDIRPPQYVVDIMVQKIFDSWGFSSLAAGPSAVFSTRSSGKFGAVAVFFNLRFKLGTSL